MPARLATVKYLAREWSPIISSSVKRIVGRIRRRESERFADAKPVIITIWHELGDPSERRYRRRN
jgi:hypothetical protein